LLNLPLNVALVFNQKKEEQKKEENYEPPSKSNFVAAELKGESPSPVFTQIQNQYYDDIYAEWDTFETIDAVRSALAEIHNVTLIEADKDAYLKLQQLKPDIVFNIAEGFNGVSREAQIPAMLDLLQIPYTGSDPLTLGICLDKARAKEILSYYGIPTPSFHLVSSISELAGASVRFPSIVKPQHEGSSKGIFNSSIVNNKDELIKQVAIIIETYREGAIVEEFLTGREFTVAIIGNEKNARVLPIVEIKFDSLPQGVNPIYSYEAKWIWDNAESPLEIFECPAKISPALQTEIEDICLKTYSILKCRDWCRIDVRLDAKGNPNILELNPLPGILPKPEDNSCFPKAARAVGMNYNKLIQQVLSIATERYGLNKSKYKTSMKAVE
jgi:D-alanine-D-alanine ligase